MTSTVGSFVGPLASIILLFFGRHLYGWLSTQVLDTQLRRYTELNDNFGDEVRTLSAFYADYASVLSNFIVATASASWYCLFVVSINSVRMLLVVTWLVVGVKTWLLIPALAAAQDLRPYHPTYKTSRKATNVKLRLRSQKITLTCLGMMVPLLSFLLKIKAIEDFAKAVWS